VCLCVCRIPVPPEYRVVKTRREADFPGLFPQISTNHKALLRKLPAMIGHPMGLRHPVVPLNKKVHFTKTKDYVSGALGALSRVCKCVGNI